MSIIKPKTVVLTHLPGYTVNLPSSGSDYDIFVDDGSEGDSEDGGVPRKRRRLTNLTAEEKMMRRKLKNRMAAQTARDRKKQRMTELEEELARRKAENKQLCQQNESLMQLMSVLSQENKTLKTQLETSMCPARVGSRIMSEATPESAAGEASDTGSANNAALGGVLCDDDQPDLSAGLVHQFDEVVVTFKQQGATTSDECNDAPSGDHSIKTEQEVDVEVVGTTPEVLDSFNELIKFDHMYYKKPLADETPTVSNITAAASAKPNQNSAAVPNGNSTCSKVKSDQVSHKKILYSTEDFLTFPEDFGNVIGEELGLTDPDLNRISELLDQLVSEATPEDTEKLPNALSDNTSDESFLDKIWHLSYQTPTLVEDNNASFFLSSEFSSDVEPYVEAVQNVTNPSCESVSSSLELDFNSAPVSPVGSCISSQSSGFESKLGSPFESAVRGAKLIADMNYNSPRISIPSPASSLDSAFEMNPCTIPDFLDESLFRTKPETNHNCSTVTMSHCRPDVPLGLGLEYDNGNSSTWCNSEFDWGDSCSDLHLDTDLFPSLYSLA